MLRSIIAIVGGYLSIAILTMLTFAVLFNFFPGVFSDGFPPLPWVLLILALGFVYAVVGGYITAYLATRDRFGHVLALAGMMAVLGISSAIFSSAAQPLWYQLALIVLGLAGVLLGGRWRATSTDLPGS
jgi:hypothetical protein